MECTFQSLGIDPSILKSVEELGFEVPSEIQEKAIPVLKTLKNKDFIGQAQTGTGKTAAFAIPLLEKIDRKNNKVQALILAPTRELASQVEAQLQVLGKYTGIRSTCVYGGARYDKQIRAIKTDKAQIIVGTPGRTIDLINKGIIDLSEAKHCVLDEADEMLNMGFFEDISTILGAFREDRQLIMFSATMPRNVIKLIDKSFQEYEMIKIERKSLSNADIEQKYFVVKHKYFLESLSRLIDIEDDVYGIVFCKTKIETREVSDALKERGYKVEVLNGDMGQQERDLAMRKFKEKQVKLLVCTDVAARGIDVNNLTHVFNFGLPQDNESYVHRIGRTGRAGMKGKAYTLVSPGKAYAMRGLERHIQDQIHLDKLPNVKDLKSKIIAKELKSVENIFQAIEEKGDEFHVDSSFTEFAEKFKHLNAEQLMKLMFTWKFNPSIRYYDSLANLDAVPSGRSGGGSGSGRRERRGGRPGARRSGGDRSGTGSRSGGSRGGRRSAGSRDNDRSGTRPSRRDGSSSRRAAKSGSTGRSKSKRS